VTKLQTNEKIDVTVLVIAKEPGVAFDFKALFWLKEDMGRSN
jgi:hypothetical protein